MSQGDEQAVVKLSTQAEQEARKKFSSGIAGNLWLDFRWSQSQLAGLLANPISLLGSQTPEQRALLAVAFNCYKLSRSADLVIMSGYALQAVSLVRAIYERIAIALRVRSDRGLAEKLLAGKLAWSDVSGVVADWRNAMPSLIDEFMRMQGFSEYPKVDFTVFNQSIGPLYGRLSSFAHPGQEANRFYFLVDPESGKAAFGLLPDGDASPFSIVILLYLAVMQFTLKLLLLIDFADPNDAKWKGLVHMLGMWLTRFSQRVESYKAILEPYMQP